MTGIAPCEVFRLGENMPRERVLWIDRPHGQLVTIDIDAPRALPALRAIEEIAQLLDEGVALRLDDPWLRPVLEEALPPAWRDRRDMSWRLIEPLVRAQPDTFFEARRAALTAEIAAKEGSNRFTIYRLLRRYWQRGMTPNALLPDYAKSGGPGKSKSASDRKRGMPPRNGPDGLNITPEIRESFKIAVQRYYAKKKNMILSDCYNELLDEFFTDLIMDEKTGRQKGVQRDPCPSLRQFRYWLQRDNDLLALDRKRRTPRVYDKDRRGLLGSSRLEVTGPRDRFQIDATIADVFLVSRFDRHRIVGRPTIYVVVDVFSGMIVGLYVGFEHPSWLGAMMALVNAASDKVDWCRQYDVEIAEADWPCATLPRTLLADRGEMLGPKADVLIKNFQIHLENTAPYRADWKGMVEQQFRLLPAVFRDHAPGYIETDFKERGAHDYRQDAVFSIDEFITIIIRCVLFYNNEREITGYVRDRGMIAEDVRPVPVELWEWGQAVRSGALRRYPSEQVRLSLLPTDTAAVTTRGVEFHDCLYSCPLAIEERWFDRARQKGRWRVNVSYDPRLMDEIFIHDAKGEFGFLRCGMTDLSGAMRGMTLWEIDALRRDEKARGSAAERQRREARINVNREIKEIARQASAEAAAAGRPAESAAARVRGIRANRAAELDAERRAAVARPALEPGASATVTPIRPDVAAPRDFRLPSVARFRKRRADEEEDRDG
ncbi:Mu transposase C-terminal domain-containing protein [Rubrimonas sp.]|uniref:Mu transposase C-terminal domain-containing protein n=1 Tax=Rubrimonas sp. TaxID=2036015 RepID=UPI002FDE039D